MRLRALNQLVEIDASALRFDLEETRRFLEQEVPGSTGEAAALQEKTEGWPVMMRIITATSQQSGQEFSGYVRQLSVRNQPIHSHLVDMLNGLPGDTVSFLLKTSILESLCAPLCRAVTGMEQAGEIFETLTARQLLLAPLDTEGLWFRCHPLLRGFLQHRLEMEFPASVGALHRRAYAWYADEQRWTDAIRHAIAVGDTDQAVKWLEACAMALLRRGELLTLFAWERTFPPELMRRQTKARLAIAWGMALAMRFDEALQLATLIEKDSGGADPRLRDGIRCECQTIRAVALALADDIDAALALAEESLSSRASGPWTTNVAVNVALMGWWKRGELERCYSLPWISFPGDDGAQNVVATVYRLCLLGLIEYAQLHQATALRHFKGALRVASDYAGPHSAAAAQPAVLIAQCLYDHGQLDDAQALILGRLPTINAVCMLECVLRAYTILIRIAIARGHRDEAEDLLNQASELALARRWSRLEARMLRERVHIALAEGQISAAASYVSRLRHLPGREIQAELDFSDALLHAAQADRAGATRLLHSVKESALASRNKALELECAVAQAVVLAADDACSETLPDIRAALDMAWPCGRMQVFLDHLLVAGNNAAASFRQAVLATDHPGAVGLARLIEAQFLSHEAHGQVAECGTAALSPREQNILQLLLEGKSNKGIARDLNVTPETIKTHLKRLFQKLNVSSRSQAVAKYYQHSMHMDASS